MIGGFDFSLKGSRIDYRFTVHRKITKIIGNSATGKTVLCDAVYNSQNKRSGLEIFCKYECLNIDEVYTRVLHQDIQALSSRFSNRKGQDFQLAIREMLDRYDNILFFCDETFRFLSTTEFAMFCKYTDSFFVICSRDKLEQIPYSYKEIYTIKSSGKFHTLERAYHDKCSINCSVNEFDKLKILLEDSKSGFQFYSKYNSNVDTSRGKSNLVKCLYKDKYDLVIADGAAIGSNISELITYPVQIFLPESFEYMLLNSSMFEDSTLRERLKNTELYANGLYFSWEVYYTILLQEFTKDTRAFYTKAKLSKCFYEPCCSEQECPLNKVYNKFEDIMGKYFEKLSYLDFDKF